MYNPIPTGCLLHFGGMCERRWWLDQRHLTARSGRFGGAGLPNEMSVQHNVFSWRYDLGNLNPKYHKNYSIIFTEISFFPETTILFMLFFILSTSENWSSH